jgi:hypothetical protein
MSTRHEVAPIREMEAWRIVGYEGKPAAATGPWRNSQIWRPERWEGRGTRMLRASLGSIKLERIEVDSFPNLVFPPIFALPN